MEQAHTNIMDVPTVVPGLERQGYGGRTVVTAGGSTHLILDDVEVAVLDSIDGSSTTADLAARFGPVVHDLVDELRAGGMLTDSPARQPDDRVRVTKNGLEFTGFGRFVSGVYRLGGRLLLTRPGMAIMVAVAVAGLGSLTAHDTPRAGFSPLVTLAALVASGYVATLLHETAHGLVLIHHGRRIGRAGFGFYWGAVAFFVDASDALMLPKRTRVAQALAGPFADAAIAGALTLASLASGSHAVGTLLVQIAVLQWLNVATNLVPLLELDGYWVLADLLDEPDLRRQSQRALRSTLSGRIDGRTRLLAAYAVASVAFGTTITVAGVWVWLTHYGAVVADAWAAGWSGKMLAGAFAGPTAAALLVGFTHLFFRRTSREERR